MRLCVAAVQIGAFKQTYADQMENIERLVGQVVRERHVDIICLPELMTTPYFPRSQDPKWRESAEPLPGGNTYECISALAKKAECTIIASCYERQGERRYNTAFIVGPDGTLKGRYLKTHIPFIEAVFAYETLFFDPGPDLPVFNILGVPVGILICYDRSFPEAWRTLALKGAQVIFVPASAAGFHGDMYADELRIAAAQNQVFVVAVNKAGEESLPGEPGTISFFGKSRVIGPLGNVIVALERDEDAYITAEIDIEAVTAARQILSYYRDRRQDLYVQSQ